MWWTSNVGHEKKNGASYSVKRLEVTTETYEMSAAIFKNEAVRCLKWLMKVARF
jgi:hypothetical protein